MFAKCFKNGQVFKIIEDICHPVGQTAKPGKNTGKYKDLAEVRTGADPRARGVPGKKRYANSVTFCIFIIFIAKTMVQVWEIALRATAYFARGYRTNVAKYDKYLILLDYCSYEMFQSCS